jgi:hypothetical protein
LTARGLLANDIQTIREWIQDNTIHADNVNDETSDNKALILDMNIDDEEHVYVHFTTKTMLKTLHDCITSWPEHTNPHDPVIAIDGTFNVTN